LPVVDANYRAEFSKHVNRKKYAGMICHDMLNHAGIKNTGICNG
jgi:hypothetical protein